MIFDPTIFGPSACASPLTRLDAAAPEPPPVASPKADRPPEARIPPPEARVPLTAVLCRGDTYLAWADGAVPASGGPSGPGSRGGVGQFTRALFPARNPESSFDGQFDFF
jgi:hypothetical protein